MRAAECTDGFGTSCECADCYWRKTCVPVWLEERESDNSALARVGIVNERKNDDGEHRPCVTRMCVVLSIQVCLGIRYPSGRVHHSETV